MKDLEQMIRTYGQKIVFLNGKFSPFGGQKSTLR